MNSCIKQLLILKSQWSLLSSIIQFLPKAHVVLSSCRHFQNHLKIQVIHPNVNSWATNLYEEFNACFCPKPHSNSHLFLVTL